MKLKMEEERQRLLKKNNKIIILPKHKLVIDYIFNKPILLLKIFNIQKNMH